MVRIHLLDSLIILFGVLFLLFASRKSFYKAEDFKAIKTGAITGRFVKLALQDNKLTRCLDPDTVVNVFGIPLAKNIAGTDFTLTFDNLTLFSDISASFSCNAPPFILIDLKQESLIKNIVVYGNNLQDFVIHILNNDKKIIFSSFPFRNNKLMFDIFPGIREKDRVVY